MTDRTCTESDCAKPAIARGMCQKHYDRWNYARKARGLKMPPRAPRHESGPEIRFWKYAVPADNPEDCWDWSGTRAYVKNLVYPRYMHLGRRIWAHRFACELLNGPEPFDGAHARHLCGNSLCVNPNHMAWGTAAENINDMEWHGTRMHGESHHQAKLTEADVIYIRSSSESGAELGRRFGVTKEAIYYIRNRHTWKHVP